MIRLENAEGADSDEVNRKIWESQCREGRRRTSCHLDIDLKGAADLALRNQRIIVWCLVTNKQSRSYRSIVWLAIFFLLLLVGIVAPLTLTGAANGDSDQLATLSRALAAALTKSNAKSVVVFDLIGPDGQSLPFGAWLADRISSSLPNVGLQTPVIDRNKLAREISDLDLSQKGVGLEDKARISEALGADFFVDGTFGAVGDHIGITLVARNRSDIKKKVYTSMVNGKILLDTEVETHLGVTLDSLRPSDGIFKSGIAGMTVPQCDYCPLPQFSVSGVWNKKQGTVILALLISAEGRATQIKVIRSLGSELDQQAIAAAEVYRFRPALDPDGKPVAVLMPYTVTFRVAN
jgi:TonB family protein